MGCFKKGTQENLPIVSLTDCKVCATQFTESEGLEHQRKSG